MIPDSPVYPRSSLGVAALHLLRGRLTDPCQVVSSEGGSKLPSALNHALDYLQDGSQQAAGEKTAAESLEELQGKEAQCGSESLGAGRNFY